jgi:hypothetical protein
MINAEPFSPMICQCPSLYQASPALSLKQGCQIFCFVYILHPALPKD